MQTQRTLEMLHPILREKVDIIQKEVIYKYKMPFKLFETGRTKDRHQMLISKGKTKNIISEHLYDLEIIPPLYATGVDFVYFDKTWSWNLRDLSIFSWYNLFGNLVLDVCPELKWGAFNRKMMNYTHFVLRKEVIVDNISKFECSVI